MNRLPRQRQGDRVERKSFPFFVAYYEAAQHLSAKDRAAFYGAIIDYSFTAKEPVLKGQAAMCWILVKPYLEKSMEDFLNGSKGGRPRKNKNPGFSENENPGFETSKPPASLSSETNMTMKMNTENEEEQRPTAPPAAYAPMQGARGGMVSLGSALDNGDRDAATEAARQKFLNSMKRPAWAAADAAPPDAEKRSDEF